MLLEWLLRGCIVVAVVVPATTLLGLAAAWLLGASLSEKVVGRTTTGALAASTVAAFVALVAGLVVGHTLEVGPLPWFSAGEHTFELALYADPLALGATFVTSLLSLTAMRFSVHYLHREPGFFRFFFLFLLFTVATHTIVLASSYDQLFVGWELSGVTSVLLIAFFHDRNDPVRSSLRALLTYRLTDVGLLAGLVLMHRSVGASHFDRLTDAKEAGIGLEAGVGALAALGLTLSAMGKAAQFPVGGWLVRAMEGPTPSSALYYGALSVHTGIFLLLRAEPILRSSPFVSMVLVGVGLGTAVVASALGRVQTDAKSALAYACRAQLGLMFLECGLGFYRLAAWHMLGHACLRAFQMLRAPSILQDHVRARAAAREPLFAAPHQGSESPLGLRTYAAAHHGFYVSVLAERMVAVPMAWISQRIEALELFWTRPFMPLDPHRSATPRPSPAGSSKPGPSAPAADQGGAS